MRARKSAGVACLITIVLTTPLAAQTPEGPPPTVSPTQVRLSTMPDSVSYDGTLFRNPELRAATPAGEPGSDLVRGPLEQELRNAGFNPTEGDFTMVAPADGGLPVLTFSQHLPDGRVTVTVRFRVTGTLEAPVVVLSFSKIFEPRVGNGFGPFVLVRFNPTAVRPVLPPQTPSVIDQIDETPSKPSQPPATPPSSISQASPFAPGDFSNVSSTSAFPIAFIGGVGTVTSGPMTITQSQATFSGQINGVPIPEEHDNSIPANTDVRMRVNTAAPTFALPLGTRTRGPGELAFVHQVTGSIGPAESVIDYRENDTGEATQWSGVGTQWSAGYNLRFFTGAGRRMFIDLSFLHTQTRSSTMITAPLIIQGLPPINPEATMTARSDLATVTFGFDTAAFSVSAGPRFSPGACTIRNLATTRAGAQVASVSSTLTIENRDVVIGVIRAEVKVPKTRIVIRADAASNGHAHSATLGVGYGWFAGGRN